MAIAPPATAPPESGVLGTPPPKRKTSRNGHLLRLPFYLLSLTMIAPFYWMVISVLKPYSELTKQPPSFIPDRPSLTNFYDPAWTPDRVNPGHQQGLFQRYQVDFGFWRFMLNSVFITTTITVGSLLIASLAAYVLTKHRIRGRACSS